MPSLTARVFQGLLGALMSRRTAMTEAQLLKAASPGDLQATPRVGRHAVIESRAQDGYRVFTVRPRIGEATQQILYLCGGGYVNGPVFLHWGFISRLATTFGATCTVPRYPLAPAAGVDDALALVSSVYRDLAARHGAENLIVMGNSAGGGLALALLQSTGMRPGKLVLHSPWLDASVSDPSQPEIETRDWLLSRFILRTWAGWWAKGRDLRDWRVSPLFGDLSNLPPTFILGESQDILAADARRLAAAAPDRVTYREEPGLMHTFALFPFLPETRRAWRDLAAFLRTP